MMVSRPAWARGLKPITLFVSSLFNPVAPRMGAWIETSEILESQRSQWVAPRMGAWIETNNIDKYIDMVKVAPRMGAWIETQST